MQILGENRFDLARFSSISRPHFFLRVRRVPDCASCVYCSSCRGARVLEGEPQGQSRALWPSSRGCRADLVRQSGHHEDQSRPALRARARFLPCCASISLSLRSGSAPLQQSRVSCRIEPRADRSRHREVVRACFLPVILLGARATSDDELSPPVVDLGRGERHTHF